MKNKYRIVGEDVFIALTDTEEVVISKEDFPAVEAMKRLYRSFDKTLNNSYVACYDGKRTIKLSRLLMDADEGMEVDHIDRDTLNYRRSNLRCVTHSVNVHNQRIRPNNTTGYKGVTYEKGKYRGRIQILGKKIQVGMFNTAKEASEAVEAIRKDYIERGVKP